MRYNACAWSVAMVAALLVTVSGGCRCKPRIGSAAGAALPAASQATQAAASEVKGAAEQIEGANRRIETAAPSLAQDTGTIAQGVSRLQAVATSLQTTGINLRDEAAKVQELQQQLDSANQTIAELNDARNGLLFRLLAFAAVAGLGLLVLSVVWLRSGTGAMTGVAVFGAAIAGQWVIEYRVVIGIASLAVAAGWIAIALIRERKATGQIVQTVEAVKGTVPNFAEIANRLQSRTTRAVVDTIQRAKGYRK